MTLMDQYKAYLKGWKPVEQLDGTWVVEKPVEDNKYGMSPRYRKFPDDKTEAGAQALADKLNAEETA